MISLTAKIISIISAAFMLFNPFASFLKNTSGTSGQPKHDVTFEMVDYDEPMEIHKKAQAEFILDSTHEAKPDKFKGKSELSRPSPADLAWTVTIDGEEAENVDCYNLCLSENRNMTDAWTYDCEHDYAKVYNVKVGATYYWTVSFEYDGDVYTSQVESFDTAANAPRNMFVDGVTNVRDIGGWDSSFGGKVKQGLIYRTGRLHNDDGTEIKEDGIHTMLDEMKVRTEIDLRYDITPREVGVLGEKVRYIILPMDFSDDMMLNEVQAGCIRDFFKILADKNNYPVFFHCSIGTDRTGVCAFLLNGLLGVCKEDLYRDYRFSNFAFIGGERDGHNITHYIELLDEYEGDELKDRIASYLISIGVTEDEIASIRSIMLDKQ